MPLSNIKIQRPGLEILDESFGFLPAADPERWADQGGAVTQSGTAGVAGRLVEQFPQAR